MTSLTTRSHRPRRPRRPHRAPPRRRLPDPAQRPRTWARCRARATSARRSASPTSSPWSTPTSCATGAEDPHWAEPRPVPALDRPLRDRALRGAGRGRDHPGRGTGDLRLRRVPAADVGHGVLHARHGDLRRLAGPRPGRRHRDGAGAAPPGQPRPGLQPALRRRARRGLDLGGGAADAPTTAWTTSPRSSTSTPCRPTARPPACCAPSRSPTSGGRSAGTPCASTATTSRRSSTRSTSCARTRGSPGGADLRHPHRPRRAAAGDPGEGALHARRRARVADRPRPARRRPRHRGTEPMTTTAPTPKKRLTTSAMIASFADPGQKTAPRPVRARPGHARRGAPGDRRAVGRPRQVHRHAHLPRRPPGPVLPDGHGRAGDARRRRRNGRGRAGAVRLDLLGVRDPPRLRLPVPGHRRAQPQRQRRRRAARPDHRVRAQPPGHRGPRDPARLPEPDDRRPVRLGRHRAGRAAAGRPRRAHLPAAAPRRGAHRARRVRLPLPAGQGRRAAHRPRRRAHLHRA